MLLGAIVIAFEAQQLEQKRAAPGVGGIVPHLDAQRLDRFVQFSSFEKLLNTHEGVLAANVGRKVEVLDGRGTLRSILLLRVVLEGELAV